MAEESPSTVSIKKPTGMRMRMGSDAQKRYQGGARTSIKDVRDAGLDIMEKMANVKLSLGDIARSHENYRIGYITDHATGCGFALIGGLETGLSVPGDSVPTNPKRFSLQAADGRRRKRPSALLGLRNYFIVKKDTTQAEIEKAFRHLSRRADIGVLVINADGFLHLADPDELFTSVEDEFGNGEYQFDHRPPPIEHLHLPH